MNKLTFVIMKSIRREMCCLCIIRCFQREMPVSAMGVTHLISRTVSLVRSVFFLGFLGSNEWDPTHFIVECDIIYCYGKGPSVYMNC